MHTAFVFCVIGVKQPWGRSSASSANKIEGYRATGNINIEGYQALLHTTIEACIEKKIHSCPCVASEPRSALCMY